MIASAKIDHLSTNLQAFCCTAERSHAAFSLSCCRARNCETHQMDLAGCCLGNHLQRTQNVNQFISVHNDQMNPTNTQNKIRWVDAIFYTK